MSLFYLMYQINREKELLFVPLSMENEKQETCVSVLSDVSARHRKRTSLCFLFLNRNRQETCVSALADVSDR